MSHTKNLKTYSEMIQHSDFIGRYNYLKLGSLVGRSTFGFDRFMNQGFYHSKEWKDIRHHVILRDNGCDLGIEGRDIWNRIIIHHMNPMDIEALESGDMSILDPEYLICVTHDTHNAVHYGDQSRLVTLPPERMPGDTRLW